MELNWLIFAFMGTVCFSAAGILDKLLLSNYSYDSKTFIVCQILAQQIFTVPVIAVIGLKFSYPESILALLFGCLQVLPSFFYMRAMQVEEVSKVTALEYIYPVFVFAGSVFLLGDVLEIKHCVGGLLLLTSSLLISYKGRGSRDKKGLGSLLAISPAVKPFVAYWIITAVYYISMKMLLSSIDEWHLYAWSSLGTLAAAIPIMAASSTRREVAGFFAKGRHAVGALMFEEVFQFLGMIATIFAYSAGSATMVSSIGALQPILTVGLILAIGVFIPKIASEIQESTDRRALIQKSLSFAVVLVGIYFVS
jgi:uncharacterized membrane protein